MRGFVTTTLDAASARSKTKYNDTGFCATLTEPAGRRTIEAFNGSASSQQRDCKNNRQVSSYQLSAKTKRSINHDI